MRKNIFEILKDNTNLSNDTTRLVKMFKYEDLLYSNHEDYNLIDFVDEYCFDDWKMREHCVDSNDFLKTVDFAFYAEDAKFNLESHFVLIEIIYNFWKLANDKLNEDSKIYQWFGNFYHLGEVMDDILEKNNHTVYIDNEKECLLVVEDKPEVSAVMEILPDSNLALDVIKYNHHSLKGKIDLKKSILLRLGSELEAKRKDLKKIDNKLTEDIFFLLNKLNIRHNNTSKEHVSNYVECVANMESSELEEWYDELYQMILLAFLLLDNKNREVNIGKLKDKILNINS
mgnify:CR=1 FL=1